MTTTAEPDLLREAEFQMAVREFRKRRASEHPAFLGHFVHCVDAKTGDEFDFDLLSEEERAEINLDGEPGGWYWHREILDSWIEQVLSLELKARQIGVTWLAALLALWTALFKPGTRVLILSVNEEEAKKVVARIWGMYKSLPPFMHDHCIVSKPARGGDPSQEIEWTHADGRKSAILALPATEKAGHGETAALVILDEYSRQDFARSIWKGVFPVIDGGGSIIIISTANGMSNPLTGEGNFFHYLWVNAMSMNIVSRFLGWMRHPDRDQDWYDTKASSLPPVDRAEQYPSTPEEAFINTGECWFDLDKLNAYRKRWREEKRGLLYRLRFEEEIHGGQPRAKKVKTTSGEWRIFVEPQAGHTYAIAADSASGKGTDFSSAHIIDLATAEWVAEYHARVGEDVFAKDLYYAARLYQRESGMRVEPWIAVENQGGNGTAVIIALRDGTRGRKPYQKLYRHATRSDQSQKVRERQDFGFPMNTDTRPTVINHLEEWIREETIPYISPELDSELRTFGRAKSLPSPRAQDGCNDDRVMSAGISLYLFRLYGKLALRREPPKRKSRWKQSLYPWENS